MKTQKPATLLELKRKELAIEQRRLALKEGLPHLYGYDWYLWAWNFFVSKNKINLLCAANQISKSSTQIRKCIDWATDTNKWQDLWPKSTPRVFWYLYPTREVATIEFEKKWVPEFMPKNEYKDHPKFGWRATYKNKLIEAVHFNSGVSVYFKTYAQDSQALQTGSVHALFCDEELPEDLIDELMLRISAANINGYFHMVFTATLNQEHWRLAIEPKEKEKENYKNAFKQQVSMYDCMVYRNGKPGPWTEELIQQVKDRCQNDAEIQRRVYGRFVTELGRTYHAYDSSRHYIKPVQFNLAEWKIYSALDNGSGGDAHPAAVVFVAVSPDYRKGYVFKGWRGDDVITAAGDVIDKWVELRGGIILTQSWYDYQAKDLGTIATRQGENIEKAEKSHDLGEGTLNTLFKNDMLQIFDDSDSAEPQLGKLSGELSALMKSTPKPKAKDDFCDALRYCVVNIPWDWTYISQTGGVEPPEMETRPLSPEEYLAQQIRDRRGDVEREPQGWDESTQEFEDYNEHYN